MKNIKLLICYCFCFITLSVNAQDLSVEEICKKNIEKMGGEAKLEKLQNVTIEQQMLMNNLEYPQNVVIINNSALKTETTIPGNKIILSVKDSSGWMINPSVDDKPVQISKSEIINYKYQTDLLGSIYHYKQKGINIALVGTEQVSGINAYKLELTYKNGFKSTAYVSAKDFFVIRITDMYKDVHFSNYKKVDDYYFPFETEIKSQMGNTILSVFKIKVNTKIDEAIFNMPAK